MFAGVSTYILIKAICTKYWTRKWKNMEQENGRKVYSRVTENWIGGQRELCTIRQLNVRKDYGRMVDIRAAECWTGGLQHIVLDWARDRLNIEG